MTYHAVLLGVEGLERGMESFSQDLQVVQAWARAVSTKYPQGRVEVYKSHEMLKERWTGGERMEVRDSQL